MISNHPQSTLCHPRASCLGNHDNNEFALFDAHILKHAGLIEFIDLLFLLRARKTALFLAGVRLDSLLS